MTDQPRRGRPPTRTAVIAAVIERLTADRRPAPTERQLRRWMQEGTIPRLDRVEAVTPQYLNQCSDLATRLGRGRKAYYARIEKWVNGHEVDEPQIRADILSGLEDSNLGSVHGVMPTDDVSVEAFVAAVLSDLDARSESWGAEVVRRFLENVKIYPEYQFLRNAEGYPSVSAGDAWDETVDSKKRAMVSNLVSAMRGSGIYWPQAIVRTISDILRSIGVQFTADELETASKNLQALFEPSHPTGLGETLIVLWDWVVIEGVKTAPLNELLSIIHDPRVVIGVRLLPKLADPNTDLNSPRYTMLAILYALFSYRFKVAFGRALESGDGR